MVLLGALVAVAVAELMPQAGQVVVVVDPMVAGPVVADIAPVSLEVLVVAVADKAISVMEAVGQVEMWPQKAAAAAAAVLLGLVVAVAVAVAVLEIMLGLTVH